MIKNSLKRSEMLKSRKMIKTLFEEGSRIKNFPFTAFLLPIESQKQSGPCLFMPIVSKRKFKRAVDRNRIKRLIKEVYRLNKGELYSYLTENNKMCLLAVMYNGNEIPTFEIVQNKVNSLLKRVPEEYEKHIE